MYFHVSHQGSIDNDIFFKNILLFFRVRCNICQDANHVPVTEKSTLYTLDVTDATIVTWPVTRVSAGDQRDFSLKTEATSTKSIKMSLAWPHYEGDD